MASVRRGRTWSGPQVISGPLSSTVMGDRFQPWLTVDGAGLHAMWCERVADPNGGPDFIRADKADLSLAIRHRAPAPINGGEAAISTVAFPVLNTDGGCYMGDYNQIAMNGRKRFVSWGDTRATLSTPRQAGSTNRTSSHRLISAPA